MFDQLGQIIIDKDECSVESDELMMISLDAGADDFIEESDSYEVLMKPEEFQTVKDKMDELQIPLVSAEVTMIPQTYITLSDEIAIKGLLKTLDLLDIDDDVQDVYTNWDE